MNLMNFTDVDNLTPLTSSTFSPQTVLPNPPLSDPVRLLLAVLLSLTIVISLCGNSVLCWLVYRKPVMRSAINLLLAHLALSDICLSVFLTPLPVVSLVAGNWIFGYNACVASGFLHSVLIYVGVLTLLAISLDRYLIIVHRKEKLTVTRAKILILTSWVVSCALHFPPLVGWSTFDLQAGLHCTLGNSRSVADTVYVLLSTLFTTMIPLLLMVYSFIYIMATLKKKRVRVQDQPREVHMSYNRKVVAMTLSAVQRVTVDMGFKTRSYKTITLLFLVLCVCWAPYSVKLMLKSVLDQDDSISIILLLCFCYLKTAINPIIYCVRIQKFRETCSSVIPAQCWPPPCLPMCLTRRVNPNSVYRVRDSQSNISTSC